MSDEEEDYDDDFEDDFEDVEDDDGRSSATSSTATACTEEDDERLSHKPRTPKQPDYVDDKNRSEEASSTTAPLSSRTDDLPPVATSEKQDQLDTTESSVRVTTATLSPSHSQAGSAKPPVPDIVGLRKSTTNTDSKVNNKAKPSPSPRNTTASAPKPSPRTKPTVPPGSGGAKVKSSASSKSPKPSPRGTTTPNNPNSADTTHGNLSARSSSNGAPKLSPRPRPGQNTVAPKPKPKAGGKATGVAKPRPPKGNNAKQQQQQQPPTADKPSTSGNPNHKDSQPQHNNSKVTENTEPSPSSIPQQGDGQQTTGDSGSCCEEIIEESVSQPPTPPLPVHMPPLTSSLPTNDNITQQPTTATTNRIEIPNVSTPTTVQPAHRRISVPAVAKKPAKRRTTGIPTIVTQKKATQRTPDTVLQQSPLLHPKAQEQQQPQPMESSSPNVSQQISLLPQTVEAQQPTPASSSSSNTLPFPPPLPHTEAQEQHHTTTESPNSSNSLLHPEPTPIQASTSSNEESPTHKTPEVHKQPAVSSPTRNLVEPEEAHPTSVQQGLQSVSPTPILSPKQPNQPPSHPPLRNIPTLGTTSNVGNGSYTITPREATSADGEDKGGKDDTQPITPRESTTSAPHCVASSSGMEHKDETLFQETVTGNTNKGSPTSEGRLSASQQDNAGADKSTAATSSTFPHPPPVSLSQSLAAPVMRPTLPPTHSTPYSPTALGEGISPSSHSGTSLRSNHSTVDVEMKVQLEKIAKLQEDLEAEKTKLQRDREIREQQQQQWEHEQAKERQQREREKLEADTIRKELESMKQKQAELSQQYEKIQQEKEEEKQRQEQERLELEREKQEEERENRERQLEKEANCQSQHQQEALQAAERSDPDNNEMETEKEKEEHATSSESTAPPPHRPQPPPPEEEPPLQDAPQPADTPAAAPSPLPTNPSPVPTTDTHETEEGKGKRRLGPQEERKLRAHQMREKQKQVQTKQREEMKQQRKEREEKMKAKKEKEKDQRDVLLPHHDLFTADNIPPPMNLLPHGLNYRTDVPYLAWAKKNAKQKVHELEQQQASLLMYNPTRQNADNSSEDEQDPNRWIHSAVHKKVPKRGANELIVQNPEAIKMEKLSSTTASLKWSRPQGVPAGMAPTFKVLLSADQGKTFQRMGVTPKRHYTLTSLIPNTLYHVTVVLKVGTDFQAPQPRRRKIVHFLTHPDHHSNKDMNTRAASSPPVKAGLPPLMPNPRPRTHETAPQAAAAAAHFLHGDVVVIPQYVASGGSSGRLKGGNKSKPQQGAGAVGGKDSNNNNHVSMLAFLSNNDDDNHQLTSYTQPPRKIKIKKIPPKDGKLTSVPSKDPPLHLPLPVQVEPPVPTQPPPPAHPALPATKSPSSTSSMQHSPSVASTQSPTTQTNTPMSQLTVTPKTKFSTSPSYSSDTKSPLPPQQQEQQHSDVESENPLTAADLGIDLAMGCAMNVDDGDSEFEEEEEDEHSSSTQSPKSAAHTESTPTCAKTQPEEAHAPSSPTQEDTGPTGSDPPREEEYTSMFM